MLTDSELRQFYDDNVVRRAARARRDREKILSTSKKHVMHTVVISVVTGIVAAFFHPLAALAVIPIGAMIASAIRSNAADRAHKVYLDAFNSIIPELLEASGLRYSANRFIPHEEYRKSCISFQRPSLYEGCDLVCGCSGRTQFAFSSLVTGAGGDVDKSSFSGVLWLADFNKDFSGFTLVFPEERLSCDCMGSLTKMEDVAFEKNFKIYTDDNVAARYVLTPLMMQKIKNLREICKNKKIIVSFSDSTMYVAFPGASSPLLYCGEELTFTFLKKLYAKLSFYCGLAGFFDLNTRIWTKE